MSKISFDSLIFTVLCICYEMQKIIKKELENNRLEKKKTLSMQTSFTFFLKIISL